MHRFRCGKFAGRKSGSVGSMLAEGASCRLLPGVKRTWTSCCAIGNRPRPARAGSYFCPASQVLESHGWQRASWSISRKSSTPAAGFIAPPTTRIAPFIRLSNKSSGSQVFDRTAAPVRNLLGWSSYSRRPHRILSRDAAVVADLLALPLEEHDATPAMSPQQKLELTLTVLLEQIESVAARAPLLIVFEDVHWIDPTSLELLDRIILRIADFPVLLVITFRPEFQPTWLGLRNVTMLPLSRLGRRDATAIIGSMAQGKALPGTTLEQILLHSDGVPLYIEELTRSVLESGLQRETTHWVSSIAVPTTLRATLMPRLDRLGSAKNVALTAATIGREFSYELVAAVSGLTQMDLDAALERLTNAGLVYRRGAPPAATYSFKHTMVQDAAYATMLKRPRRQLHTIIAKTLIAQFPSVADRMPEVVAHHFAEAGLASEAIVHWVKAGQVAYERGANREAIEFFERGLTLLASLPESRSTLVQALDIHLELPQALIQLGEIPQALLRLREADRLAEQLKDDYRQGQVHSFKAITHALIGELDDALLAGRRALKTVERLDDHARCIHARTILQQVHFYRGEHKRVVALATTNLAALHTDFGISGSQTRNPSFDLRPRSPHHQPGGAWPVYSGGQTSS